jgi:hypothetical protein
MADVPPHITDPMEIRHWKQARGDNSWRADQRREKRCSNCGLLGQVERATQQLVPMLEQARNRDGTRPPDYSTDPLKRYSRIPVCTATQRYFHGATETLPWPKYFQELEADQTRCPSFVQWVPGLSIRDHREMLERLVMIEREDRRDREMRDREDQRDEIARKQALEMTREMRKREDERDTRLEQLQRELHNKEMLILGFVVTAALTLSGIAAAILEGAISNGWEPGWWPW